ncbi:hypothetical protein BD413DRAFT_615492 [Trametes elegans]|nr:hypothetical protein BD413DRAFT_615492 [Trametes elegans]
MNDIQLTHCTRAGNRRRSRPSPPQLPRALRHRRRAPPAPVFAWLVPEPDGAQPTDVSASESLPKRALGLAGVLASCRGVDLLDLSSSWNHSVQRIKAGPAYQAHFATFADDLAVDIHLAG